MTEVKFDLAQLDLTAKSNDGEWLELEHPVTGEPLGIKIKLAGVDSDIYKKQLRKLQDRRLRKGLRTITAEEFEEEQLQLLVACTLDWKGMIYEGKELEPTKENIRMIYEKFGWIREQVDNFIGDRRNFLKS